MSLIESTNGNFVARTAFYIKSNTTGRILAARTTDTISISGTAVSYAGGSAGASIQDSDYVSALTKLDVVEGVLLLNAVNKTSAQIIIP